MVEGEVVIPEKVSDGEFDFTVIEIGDWSFFGNQQMSGIKMPDTVRRIGKNAFDSSYLHDIVLSSSLEYIGDYAFAHSPGCIGTLTIPKSVTTIGDYAFLEFRWFSILFEGPVNSIGENAFLNNEIRKA